MTQHASDCAVHNAPALEPGECDCGDMTQPAEKRAEPTPGPWEWTVQDHSMAILHGPDMLVDHVAAVGPCRSCTKRVTDGEWKWGRCMTPTEANARLIAAAPNTATERDKLQAANAELVKALAHYRAGDERLVESGALESVFDRPATAVLAATPAAALERARARDAVIDACRKSKRLIENGQVLTAVTRCEEALAKLDAHDLAERGT